jgi:hypothetical protein
LIFRVCGYPSLIYDQPLNSDIEKVQINDKSLKNALYPVAHVTDFIYLDTPRSVHLQFALLNIKTEIDEPDLTRSTAGSTQCFDGCAGRFLG